MTSRFQWCACLCLVVAVLAPAAAEAQTLYHLHAEQISPYGVPTLQTGDPHSPSTFIETQNLKNASNNTTDSGRFFRSVAPSVAGTIPSGSTFTFSVWLKKSSNWGVFYPYFKAWSYDNDNPFTGSMVSLCSVTGSGSDTITTTLTKFTLSCNTSSAFAMTTTRAYRVDVGTFIQTGPGNHNITVQIYHEGALNGNYDSTVSAPTPPPPPSISSLSPSSAAIGATVTVNGSGFGSTQGTSTLTLNSNVVTPNTWGATSIQFTIPAGAVSGPVQVTVNGVNSNTQTLTIPPPNITGLSPGTASVGAVVAVNGTNFGSTQGTSTLTLDNVTVTPTSWNATAIQFTVPSWATSGAVKVTVNGSASNNVSLTVPPVISSLSPSSGHVQSAVTINGTGFGSSQGTSTVKFGGDVMTPSSWSATAIGFETPIRNTSTVEVNVKGVGSNTPTFTITAPVITSLTPNNGGVGTYVTISGTGFGTNPSVGYITLNGNGTYTGAPGPISWTWSSILWRVPNEATTGPVVVTLLGLPSNGVTFTVTTTGSISGIVRRASDQALLSGVQVKASQNSVVIGTATTAADGTYTITGLPVGQYDVVAYPSGYLTASLPGILVTTAGASAINFYVNKPVISSISPGGGPVGTVVTINGVRFGTTQGTSTVTFNGTSANPTTWSDSKIVAPVPSSATTGQLVVTVEGAGSNSIAFGVGTGTISGTVTQLSGGNPVSGATVEVLRSNAVVAATSTIVDGTYSAPNLPPDTYDVRFSATGFGTIVSIEKVVTASGATSANASLPGAGGIGGKVTRADGITPISGAAVTISMGAAAVSTVFTDGAGDYVSDALGPATYYVQASAPGYIPQNQSSVAVTVGNTTTKNFSLLGQSAISYAYDSLGRLIGVTDSLGDTATYTYDAVGNITAIGRYSSSSVSVIGFAPSHAAAGAQVTIYGTAFSATPSSNTVSFNGTSATVMSASTTQLTVTVPVGASSGTIAVTSPSGSATSANVFSIP